MTRAGRWLRALAGGTVAVLAVVPLYYWVGDREMGIAGRATADIIATQAGFLWSGALVLALLGLLAGLFLPADAWARPMAALRAALGRGSPVSFALVLASLSFAATAGFTILVLEGKPNLIDVMAQLVQARYMAAGRLAGPVLEDPGFWFIQNTVQAESGWASQYPPGHTTLLAGALRLGALELTGAVLMALTAAFAYLALRRLLPGREAVVRLGGLGVALSPFLVSQAGAYMNHGSAAAFSTLAIYFALRSRDGRAAWGLALGAALGALLTSRPLFALVIAFGVVAPLAIGGVRRRTLTTAEAFGRVGLAVVGGLPFVALFLAYNHAVFGGPLDMGYVLAWGESVGLGFHRDPWGNLYSPRAALGYTSADLTALSLSLFETPLPIVPVIGIWLAARPRLRPGEGVLFAWALVPVAANFFYWHHGYFMGPRMLAESVPAWSGAAMVVLASLVARVPESWPAAPLRFAPRSALVATLVLAAAGAAYLAPLRLLQRGGDYLPSMRLEAPATPAPALVFVHGAWSGRVFGRLAADGRPLHVLERTLRERDLCRLQQALDGPGAGGTGPAPAPAAREPVDLEVFPGNTVTLDPARVEPDGTLALPEDCLRELRADRHGIVDVAVLLWRGGLPGLEGDRTLYVRDLGPRLNERLRKRYPDRESHVLARERLRGDVLLLPYPAGMQRIWGRAALTGPAGASEPTERGASGLRPPDAYGTLKPTRPDTP